MGNLLSFFKRMFKTKQKIKSFAVAVLLGLASYTAQADPLMLTTSSDIASMDVLGKVQSAPAEVMGDKTARRNLQYWYYYDYSGWYDYSDYWGGYDYWGSYDYYDYWGYDWYDYDD